MLSQLPAGPYPLGSTPVTLTATDAQGAASSCEATVTVQDTTAPAIDSLSITPNILKPANHKLIPAMITVVAADNCAATPACHIVDVTSNEPDSGRKGGNKSPDWEITGDLTLNLRAERAPTGSGRVYTVNVACTDAAGNQTNKTVTVDVPR